MPLSGCGSIRKVMDRGDLEVKQLCDEQAPFGVNGALCNGLFLIGCCQGTKLYESHSKAARRYEGKPLIGTCNSANGRHIHPGMRPMRILMLKCAPFGVRTHKRASGQACFSSVAV